ncbi:MAG: tRNA pseudouridine(55) synthase TruB [Lachnospiraceae bacterium]|nr:tRNA pseudouridine(55) synthase TruB [Lachnospiraceae bacterium]
MYNGLINVYKEPGFTSFDAVAVLRGILKQKKIGHTGTLDPAAEGVLMVCLGNATKLCSLLEDKDKEYECVMRLGITTDTEDMTGQVLSEKNVENSEEEIREAILSFVGKIKQVPPMYSALKKDGKKLYELARKGIEVEREARDIEIYDINIREISLPRAVFTVKCSKGTYIRSLCRDIGEKLGCGGCMEHLKRNAVSFFDVSGALKLSEIEALSKEGKIDDFIIRTEEVFKDLPSIKVEKESARIINNGNPLLSSNIESILPEEADKKNGLYRVYNTGGEFCAVYEYDSKKDYYKPYRMFFSE